MSDLTGEILDSRYRLIQLIASGGMASIYSAEDLRLDRQVAVKVMHPHLANDEEFVMRFIREARATATLSHPNIVAIQDQGWNEGGAPAVFLVMEFIDGYTLRDYLNQQGALKIEQIFRFALPVLSALSAAHKVGIVHRDIKPENILVAKDGRVKVADFGLARGAGLGMTMTIESSVVLGSVSYLAPEQIKRGIADSRSDLYSFGIMLFEMLVGRKPFEGQTPIEIALKHIEEGVPAPRTVLPKVPMQLDAFVQRLTSINPDDRPVDASEALTILREIQAEIDPHKRQLSLELDLSDIPIAPPGTRTTRRTNSTSRKSASTSKRNKQMQNDSLPLNIKEKSLERINRMLAQTTQNSGEVRRSVMSEDSGQVRRRKTSARVKRNRVIASLILVVSIVAMWFALVGPGARITVPSVVGLTTKQAIEELIPLGLTGEVRSKVFSEEVKSGRIIDSIPAGGDKVKPKSVVGFVVSKGVERISIPRIRGLTPDVGSAQITSAGLKVGNVIEIFDPKIQVGKVVSTNPAGGLSAKRGSLVDINVSKGAQLLSLSSYIGKVGEQALTELTDAGFAVNAQYEFSDTVVAGAVIAQDPPNAEALAKGSAVTITISKGSEFVYVPNIYSQTIAQATKNLEDLQLVVKVRKIGNRVMKTVTNVSPSVGSKVKRGAVVTITVG